MYNLLQQRQTKIKIDHLKNCNNVFQSDKHSTTFVLQILEWSPTNKETTLVFFLRFILNNISWLSANFFRNLGLKLILRYLYSLLKDWVWPSYITLWSIKWERPHLQTVNRVKPSSMHLHRKQTWLSWEPHSRNWLYFDLNYDLFCVYEIMLIYNLSYKIFINSLILTP